MSERPPAMEEAPQAAKRGVAAGTRLSEQTRSDSRLFGMAIGLAVNEGLWVRVMPLIVLTHWWGR